MLLIMIPIIAKLKFIMFLLPFQISFQNSKPDNLCVDGIVTHHLMVCNKFLVIFLDFYTVFLRRVQARLLPFLSSAPHREQLSPFLSPPFQ